MGKGFLLLITAVLFCRSAHADDFSALIEIYAAAEQVDPLLVKAIMHHESRGKVTALSPAGAQGLMQVMPDTAKFVGVDPGQLYQPEQNIKAGVRYLAFLQKYFHGDVEKMVAAYNAGHFAVEKYGGIPPYKETIDYTKNVLASYGRGSSFFSGKSSLAAKERNKSARNFIVFADGGKEEKPAIYSRVNIRSKDQGGLVRVKEQNPGRGVLAPAAAAGFVQIIP